MVWVEYQKGFAGLTERYQPWADDPAYAPSYEEQTNTILRSDFMRLERKIDELISTLSHTNEAG